MTRGFSFRTLYFVLCTSRFVPGPTATTKYQAQNSSNSQVTQVSCFHHQSSGNRRRRSRSITTALDDYRDRQLRFLERRDAQEPAVNSRMLFVHNDLFVLANDVAFVVALDAMACLWLARFGVVNRHD